MRISPTSWGVVAAAAAIGAGVGPSAAEHLRQRAVAELRHRSRCERAGCGVGVDDATIVIRDEQRVADVIEDAPQPLLAFLHRGLGPAALPPFSRTLDASQELVGLHRLDEIVVAVSLSARTALSTDALPVRMTISIVWESLRISETSSIPSMSGKRRSTSAIAGSVCASFVISSPRRAEGARRAE